MKTPLDEWNEHKGVSARPHERDPRGAAGCARCVFSEGHPVHHHRAQVIDLFADRRPTGRAAR